MKRKIVLLLLSTILALPACSSKSTSSTTQSETSTETSTEASTEASAEDPLPEKTTAEESGTQSDLDAIGSIEVDNGLFDVELTIPKDYVGDVTQEDLDAEASEKGYKSATLNEDGSATFTMTKKQHKQMLDETKDSINSSLEDLIGSEEYPNFTDIKANDNYTSFTITTKSTELDMAESFSVMIFYTYGGMYNIFAGTPVDNVYVEFVNADSGDVIASSNSKDAE